MSFSSPKVTFILTFKHLRGCCLLCALHKWDQRLCNLKCSVVHSKIILIKFIHLIAYTRVTSFLCSIKFKHNKWERICNYRNENQTDFLAGPVVNTFCFPMQGMWIWSLLRELRSHMSCGQKKKKKKNQTKTKHKTEAGLLTNSIRTFKMVHIKKKKKNEGDQEIGQYCCNRHCWSACWYWY